MLIPPGGVSAWKEEAEGGKGCVWKEAGVWKWKEKAREAVMLRCDYFNRHPETGAEVEWYRLVFSYIFIDGADNFEFAVISIGRSASDSVRR